MDPVWALLLAVVAALGGAGGVVAWRRLKRVDEPTSKAAIEKTKAETRKIEVEVLLETLQVVREERATAQTRIGELNTIVAEQGRTIATTQGDVAQLRADFEQALARARAHVPWDDRALPAARRVEPDFPDPPPLY